MKKLLKDTRGGGYFTPYVITIVIAMILSAVLFYAQCMTIIQTTRADTERVLESFIMKNSIDITTPSSKGMISQKILMKIFIFRKLLPNCRWTLQKTVCIIMVQTAKSSTP